MLDLSLSKGRRFARCRKLDIGIHLKNTNQGVPLDDRSCHPPSIHSVWPLARFSACNSRCTSNELAKVAKMHFFDKLCMHHPKHIAAPNLVQHLDSRRRIFESRASVTKKSSWLVLPFHPRLSRVAATLLGMEAHWNSNGGNFRHFMPRLSWRIGHPSLASILAKDCSTKTTKYRTGDGG